MEAGRQLLGHMNGGKEKGRGKYDREGSREGNRGEGKFWAKKAGATVVTGGIVQIEKFGNLG